MHLYQRYSNGKCQCNKILTIICLLMELSIMQTQFTDVVHDLIATALWFTEGFCLFQ